MNKKVGHLERKFPEHLVWHVLYEYYVAMHIDLHLDNTLTVTHQASWSP